LISRFMEDLAAGEYAAVGNRSIVILPKPPVNA
jgi:hypothetical protein